MALSSNPGAGQLSAIMAKAHFKLLGNGPYFERRLSNLLFMLYSEHKSGPKSFYIQAVSTRELLGDGAVRMVLWVHIGQNPLEEMNVIFIFFIV